MRSRSGWAAAARHLTMRTGAIAVTAFLAVVAAAVIEAVLADPALAAGSHAPQAAPRPPSVDAGSHAKNHDAAGGVGRAASIRWLPQADTALAPPAPRTLSAVSTDGGSHDRAAETPQ